MLKNSQKKNMVAGGLGYVSSLNENVDNVIGES